MMRLAYRAAAITQLGIFVALLQALSPAGAEAQGMNGYQEIEVTSGATVRGELIWLGGAPPTVEFPAKEDDGFCRGGGEVEGDEVTIDPETAAVRGGVVYLEPVRTGKPLDAWLSAPQYQVTIRDCRCSPTLLIMPVGATLVVASEDPVVHDVKLRNYRGDTYEEQLAVRRGSKDVRFRRDGRFRLTCERHPWEFADVLVVNHPYYTLTDEEGKFEITDVPPGPYDVVGLFNDDCLRANDADAPTSASLADPASVRKKVYLQRGTVRELRMGIGREAGREDSD